LEIANKKGDPKVALFSSSRKKLPDNLKIGAAAVIYPDSATIVAPAVALTARRITALL
jgi:hypothetical protein